MASTTYKSLAEINGHHIDATRAWLDNLQSRINTAIPAIIQSFDPITQTCTCTPTIKYLLVQDSGNQFIQAPELILVPVYTFGGGGFFITAPVKAGDEGLVIFSQRAIDNWWKEGGIQDPHILRMHSWSDGFFLPSFNPQPKRLPNYSPDTLDIRSWDNNTYIRVSDGNFHIKGNIILEGNISQTGNINQVGNYSITGDTSMTGNLSVTGNIVGELATTQISLEEFRQDFDRFAGAYNSHTHGVASGSSSTGFPIPSFTNSL